MGFVKYFTMNDFMLFKDSTVEEKGFEFEEVWNSAFEHKMSHLFAID